MATFTVPNSIPSPVEDAEAIRKAVEDPTGWGTDERALILVLAHRNPAQIKLIKEAYEQLYNENLTKRLESELKGEFEKAVYRWMLEPADRDAVLLHTALKKGDVDEKVIIEIACTRSPSQLLAVKHAYHARYKCCMEEDVASHATGDFRKLLVALVSPYRYEGPEINLRLAETEAKTLYSAIHEKTFNHEEIIRIISTRSKAQLNATFNSYKDDFGTSITKDLRGTGSEPEGVFINALRATVRCTISPQKYLEKVLRLAINRTGTDEDALTRVIVTRAEMDLKDIKDEYERRNNVTLERAVGKDTHGDYKAFLLALLGSEDH